MRDEKDVRAYYVRRYKPRRRQPADSVAFWSLKIGAEFHDAAGGIFVKVNSHKAHHDGQPDALVSFEWDDYVYDCPGYRAAVRAARNPKET